MHITLLIVGLQTSRSVHLNLVSQNIRKQRSNRSNHSEHPQTSFLTRLPSPPAPETVPRWLPGAGPPDSTLGRRDPPAARRGLAALPEPPPPPLPAARTAAPMGPTETSVILSLTIHPICSSTFVTHKHESKQLSPQQTFDLLLTHTPQCNATSRTGWRSRK